MRGMTWGSISSISDVAISTLSRLIFYWPFSWRVVSAFVFGVLLAHWFWVLLAPHATYTSTVPERSIELQAGHLFGVAVSTEIASQGIALPNVKLFGVFTASAGKAGFAILKLDDKRQLGIAESEEVISGTRLVEVHADHVILESAGVRQRINLETKYTGPPNNMGIASYTAGTNSMQNNNIIEGKMQKQLPQPGR